MTRNPELHHGHDAAVSWNLELTVIHSGLNYGIDCLLQRLEHSPCPFCGVNALRILSPLCASKQERGGGFLSCQTEQERKASFATVRWLATAAPTAALAAAADFQTEADAPEGQTPGLGVWLFLVSTHEPRKPLSLPLPPQPFSTHPRLSREDAFAASKEANLSLGFFF